MTRTILLMIAALMTAAASPANVDSLPTKGLGKYAAYRQALLDVGWQPVVLPNAYIDGRPEVLCGSGLCTASWHTPSGALVEFTLWRDEEDVLVFAPDTD